MTTPPDLAWAEVDVVLADGGVVHLRPIRPDDGDQLVAFHARLSPESRQMRFFTLQPTLSERQVERFTNVDYDRRLAFVAELHGQVIAVGRYGADPEPGDGAEVAFVVQDEHQGRGIGSILLEYLAVAARRRGISRFHADTLATNRKMKGVFHDAGYLVTASGEWRGPRRVFLVADAGVRRGDRSSGAPGRIRFDLAAPPSPLDRGGRRRASRRLDRP